MNKIPIIRKGTIKDYWNGGFDLYSVRIGDQFNK
jgi:hypothetical protein